MTSLEQQVKDIKKIYKPAKHFIAFREFPNGRIAANMFLKKNKNDVLQFGWQEYKEPEKPEAVRKTTSRTTKKA